MAGHIRVRFCADVAIPSRLIEYFGGGGWSHMANFLADGRIIDARSDRSGGQPPGVWVRPAHYLDNVAKWMDVEISCTPGQALYWEKQLLSQRGKPYDKIGILDFIDGSYEDRSWRDESAWFCDELGIWAQEGAKICPPLTTPVYKLTPGAAAMIDLALGGKIVKSRGLDLTDFERAQTP